MDQPHVFVGSSRAGLAVAQEIQRQLGDVARVVRWDEEHTFQLGFITLEVLEQALENFDFGIFLLTAENSSLGRERPLKHASENVLFEIGMFMGKLGRKRTFIVRCKDDDIAVPSDLDGITLAPYSNPSDASGLAEALTPACSKMRNAIERLGRADDVRRLRGDVERQASSLNDVRSDIEAIRAALEGVITEFEFDKLVGLDREGPFMCWYHHNLRAEMRRLFGLGYVRETAFGSGPRIDDYRSSGKEFDLKNHYALTDKGKDYLRLRQDWKSD